MHQLATALFTVLLAFASAQSLENVKNHESSNATVHPVSFTLDNQNKSIDNKSSSIDESSLTTVIDKSVNDTEIKSTETTTAVTTTTTTTAQDLLIPPATVKPQIVFANVTTKKPSRLQAAA